MLLTPPAGSQGGGSFPARHSEKEHRAIAGHGTLGKEIKNGDLNLGRRHKALKRIYLS